MLLPPVAGCAAAEASPPPTIPTAGQALRRRQPHTTAEPVNPHSPLRAGFHCHVVPFLGLAVVHRRGALHAAWSTWSRNDPIGRVLYMERLTAGSIATAQFFCDLPSKSLCQACWAANLSRRGELHSAGRENGLSVMRNGMYIFKNTSNRQLVSNIFFFHFKILNYINFYAWRICWILY